MYLEDPSICFPYQIHFFFQCECVCVCMCKRKGMWYVCQVNVGVHMPQHTHVEVRGQLSVLSFPWGYRRSNSYIKLAQLAVHLTTFSFFTFMIYQLDIVLVSFTAAAHWEHYVHSHKKTAIDECMPVLSSPSLLYTICDSQPRE